MAIQFSIGKNTKPKPLHVNLKIIKKKIEDKNEKKKKARMRKKNGSTKTG